MDVWTAIATRRVVREFADRPLEPEHLERILHAGRRAGSSKNLQRWDFVVVEDRKSAANGEMVIALVQGTSATVKRVFREPSGWVRLEPANEAVAPIRVHEDDLLIQGIVVGVMRKY